MLSGDNSILQKIGEAKTNSDIADEKEDVQMATLASASNNEGKMTKSTIQKELDASVGEGKTTTKERQGKILVTFTDSQRKYLIDNGKVSIYSDDADVNFDTCLRNTSNETGSTDDERLAAPFLGNTTVARGKIEKVTLTDSISGHTVGDKCWDVSEQQNGKILAWYEDSDNDGYYEVTIGQDGGIVANQDSSRLFQDIGYKIDAEINGLNYLDTSNVENMFCMFQACSNVKNLDVSNWDTSSSRNMAYMFNLGKKLAKVDVSNFDTSNVENMRCMFKYCAELANLDVTSWKTGNVTNMRCMFQLCTNLTELDVSNWDTSNVTDMGGMFLGKDSSNEKERVYMKIKNLDVSKWDTSKVTNMDCMFDLCSALENLDVSNWNTGKVTNMSFMFPQCYKLTKLDVSKWDTSSVTNMLAMFQNCTNLTELDVSNWNTGKVTNMSFMFFQCYKLTKLDVSKWDTSSVTNMISMFQNCTNLTELDVSNWDTSKVTDMSYFLGGAGDKKIRKLDVSKWDTSSVTNMSYMFCFCSKLSHIYASSKWNTSNVTSSDYMFYNCTSLPNFNSSKIDKTNAFIGGYLEEK